jgi:hypothetical protein
MAAGRMEGGKEAAGESIGSGHGRGWEDGAARLGLDCLKPGRHWLEIDAGPRSGLMSKGSVRVAWSSVMK